MISQLNNKTVYYLPLEYIYIYIKMLISTENSAEPRLKDEYPPAQRKQFITFISPPKENH